MNEWIVFFWIQLGFIAIASWEAAIEGRYPWASNQVGFEWRITDSVIITQYHVSLNLMIIFFLSTPLLILGWSLPLFGFLLSAAAIGFTLEDAMWFVFNPYYSLKKLNPKDAPWYPWIRIGRAQFPAMYLVGIAVGFFSWYFLWKGAAVF